MAADLPKVPAAELNQVVSLLHESDRPVILIGGGVTRWAVRVLGERTAAAGIPLMTTWNGTDRVPSEHPLYAGRPNTWGQRAANALIQQADLVIAIGTRLGLQQTGFAWEQFAPIGRVVQVDIDPAELDKGHPHVDLALCGDADRFLSDLYSCALGDPTRWRQWREFITTVRAELPLNDPQNVTAPGYVKPYELAMRLCEIAEPDAIVLPCSSGGAASVSMQALQLRAKQKLVGDKSLAAMGYGLSGAIGAALANPGRQVFLSEGDGTATVGITALGRSLRVKNFTCEVIGVPPDGFIAAMASELASGARHAKLAFAALVDDHDGATAAADAATKSVRRVEHIYRDAMSKLLDLDELREVMGSRELYRRCSRMGDDLERVADRVWYAVVKSG